jgi:hypothetical protein
MQCDVNERCDSLQWNAERDGYAIKCDAELLDARCDAERWDTMLRDTMCSDDAE